MPKPLRAKQVITMPNTEHKKVLSIENFDTMTLEERLALIDEIGSDLMRALSKTFIIVEQTPQ